jgi:hypothetical protein
MNDADDARDRTPDPRWDDLVADLEVQARAYELDEQRARTIDHTHAARATVALADRLRAATTASLDAPVVLAVRGAGPVRGAVVGAGPTWVLIDDGVRETVVVLGCVQSVTGLPDGVAAPASPVEARWGLVQVLRRHARDRATVRLVLDTGDVLTGTVDMVGADHLELAEHPPGEPRRAAAVLARRLVPFGALATVSREAARSPR